MLRERLLATPSFFFAIVALVPAGQRREIGIRIALGRVRRMWCAGRPAGCWVWVVRLLAGMAVCIHTGTSERDSERLALRKGP